MRNFLTLGLALLSGPILAQSQTVDANSPTVAFLASLEHASMIGGVRLAREQGAASSAQVECVSRQPSSIFRDAMRRFYESSLAPSEQRDADSFFSSPFGQKLSSSFVSAVSQGKPISIEPILASAEEADNRDAAAFLESSAGDKILVQGLYRKGPTRQEVVKALRDAAERCR